MHRFSFFFESGLLQRTLHINAIAPRKADGTPFSKAIFNIALQAVVLMILIMGIASASQAAQVTLAWDAGSPVPDGYRLYQREDGKSYSYANPVWQGSKPTCNLDGLVAGTQYYFVVRAYAGSEESGNSNEVSYRAAATATTQPAVDVVQTYHIESWTGSNGTITPSGTSSVTEGGSKSYTISPSTGYIVADVVVDGASVGAVTGYTFSKVSADHTIMAIFSANSKVITNYTITATAGAHGAISPSGTTSVSSGGSTTYKITPSTGYQVDTVLVDGSCKGALTSYTFSRISANHTIVAFFKESTSAESAANDQDGIDDDADGDDDSDPTGADQNQPPNTPEIVYPNAYTPSVSISPILKASDFCDPDAGDSLSKSEWLIKAAEDQHVILQTSRKSYNLSYFWVPWLVLESNATYTCQVRYYDNHDQASQWSLPVTFTTWNSKYYWNDSDASIVSVMLASTDLNANGIPDTGEPEAIRTLQSLDDQTIIGVGVEENSGATIDGALMIDPDTEDLSSIEIEGLSDYDLFAFRVLLDYPGEEIFIAGYSSNGIDPQDRWICWNAEGLWSDCTAENYIETDPTAAIRSIQDGGPTDADGVVNGVIVAVTGIEKSDEQAEQGANNTGGSDDPFASCSISAMLGGDGD